MSAPRLSLWPLNLFVLLFGLSAILGVIPAYDPELSRSALTAILSSVLLYFAVTTVTRSWLALRVVSGAALLIAALFALYFITQYGYQNYPETPSFIQRLGAMTTIRRELVGYIFHPNSLATFLEVAAPLGIARAVSSRKRWRKVFWAICTLVILYAVVLTVSYRSWLALGLVMVLAITLVITVRLPRVFGAILVGLVIVGLAGVVLIVARLGPQRLPILTSFFTSMSNLGQLFHNSSYLARDYLFTGIGLGDTFAMVYSRYGLLIFVPFTSYSNNLLFSAWLSQGLLGLVALIGIIVTFYLLVYRVIRTATPRRLFHGAWLGVTATLLHGMLDARQYADGHWTMPMLFVGIGLTVAAGRVAMQEVEQASHTQPRSILRVGAPIAAMVLVAVGVFVVFNKPIMVAWYTNLGAVDETHAELAPRLTDAEVDTYIESALVWYERALEMDTTYPNANRRLGNLLWNLDRFDEAVPYLETAYAGEPTYSATIKGLGLAYVWVGRTEEAARLLLTHDNPADVAGELNTWGYFRLDDQHRPLLAARAWETPQLMSSGGSPNLDVWLLIADTYRQADDLDNARRWYERVLELDPANTRAREALAQLGQSS